MKYPTYKLTKGALLTGTYLPGEPYPEYSKRRYFRRQLDSREKITHKNAKKDLVSLFVEKFSRQNLREFILEVGLDNLQPENLAQVYRLDLNLRHLIDFSSLEVDDQVIFFSEMKSRKELNAIKNCIKAFQRQHYRYILEHGSRNAVDCLLANLSDEDLSRFRVYEWLVLFRRKPSVTKRFNVRNMRNATQLRHMILAYPIILQHATIDDMKASSLSAASWIRVISKLPVKKRKYVPAGFIGWVEREVFKNKLGGHRYKKFGNWKNGLVNEESK